MHTVVFFMLATGSCLAYYGAYEPRVLEVRKEPRQQSWRLDLEDRLRNLVRCPVCDKNGEWLPSFENCSIKIDGVRYKECRWGIYINNKCQNSRDCLRGPGEECTESSYRNVYGAECAAGYHCDQLEGKCTDPTVDKDTRINHNYYEHSRRDRQNPSIYFHNHW